MKVLVQSGEVKPQVQEQSGDGSPVPQAAAAAEDVTMEEPSAPAAEAPRRRKQRKPRKVKLDEDGNPIQKKKRKLNHQCAAVKICHSLMQEYRGKLSEKDQEMIAKFCQLNRGKQGIVFNKMCVAMRTYLKEKYPALEKWEDMDFDDTEQRPTYGKVVNFMLDEYMEDRRKEPKQEDGASEEGAKAE